MYTDKRNIAEQIVGINKSNEETIHDVFGISQMKVDKLKLKLKERGLKTSGLKVNLSNQLLEHMKEKTYAIYANEDEKDDNDELLPGINGGNNDTTQLTPPSLME